MEMLLELGVDNIAAELSRKRAWLVPALQAKGYAVLNRLSQTRVRRRHHHRSSVRTQDLRPIHQRLADAGVMASLRTDRQGKNYLRLSPHFYNTDAELHRVVDLL